MLHSDAYHLITTARKGLGDVPLQALEVLLTIAHLGAAPQYQLAAVCGMTKSSTSRIVKLLLRKNLVWRKQMPMDRRIVHIALTGSGDGFVDVLLNKRGD